MKKNIAVIGLGTFGHELAVQLSRRGHRVLAVDTDMKKVNDIKDEVYIAVQADITDPDVLQKLDITSFDEVVLAMSHLEAVILAATHMKKMGVKHITGKANTYIQKEIFEKIGIDRIILPEIDAANELAEKITYPEIIEKVKMDNRHLLLEIKVPSHFVGKSLLDLDLRKKYGVNALMLTRNGKTGLITSPAMKFEEGDTVLLMGDEEKIHQLIGK